MPEPVFGICIPLGGGHSPVDPGYGRPGGGWSPTDPGYGNPVGGGHPSGQPVPPVPPPGIWGPPSRPDQGLPPVPPGGHIDNALPVVPGIPIYPDQGLPGEGGEPDQGLPLPPGTVWPPLPPQFTGKVLALVVVFGIGYRWAVLDLSLKPGMPLPPAPEPK